MSLKKASGLKPDSGFWRLEPLLDMCTLTVVASNCPVKGNDGTGSGRLFWEQTEKW